MSPLRQRMIEDMQVRNLAVHTHRAYLKFMSQFARHCRKSPDLLVPSEIRAFLLYLTPGLRGRPRWHPEVARELGCGTNVVQQVKTEMASTPRPFR